MTNSPFFYIITLGDKMKKVIFGIITFLFLFIPCSIKVEAKTINDIRNQIKELEAKQAQNDNSKKLTQDEIDQYTADIANLTASIKKTNDEVAEAEKSIIESQDQIENKRDQINEMMRYLQVSTGENVYLEYIFEAESYTDFIYRYALVSQMSDYNNTLMDELAVIINDLETKKKDLAAKQASMDAEKQELTNKTIALQSNLSAMTAEGTTIAEDIEDLRNEIEMYKNRGCSDNQDVTTCGMGGMNSTGWTYPLMSGCVTSEYVGNGNREDWTGSVSGHHGIDLGCNDEGTPVYAAASGYVARVVYRSSCGGNMVWVYHTVNGVPYTTVYMHMLSINVSTGQSVNTSTVVGTVGGGSTSYYNGGYDTCTSGAHLHFGMASGHNAVGFNSYSFNPRELFSFPGVYSGYFSR